VVLYFPANLKIPMEPASGSATVKRFGPFVADRRVGELRKHGIKIRLQDQPFQILAILLERPGDVVTREELHQELWHDDTFVDFDHGLNNAINRLREALGDSAETPRFIETLPRRGYRFIAVVDSVPPETKETPAIQSATPASPRPQRTRLWLGAVALAVVAFGLFALNIGGLRQRWLSGGAGPQVRSLAVLPLVNLSGDSGQEYFADGITDALTTQLAQFGSLRVISRASTMQYKGTKKPLPQIARELNVDAIVEGSAARRGNRVRLTVQLIQGATESLLRMLS
jgi:TolB-like protein/DNA-binding winged helix-turn-helix (wHTH) protein